jgi:hypothetical protein
MSQGDLIEIDDSGQVTGGVTRATNDVSKVQTAIGEMRRRGFNVMAPETYLENDADMEYSIRVLDFDDDLDPYDNRDFYQPAGSGKWAPHKSVCDQIASAFGIQWLDTEREDDFQHPHLASVKVTALVPNPATGEYRKHQASKTIDLREGAAEYEDIMQRHDETWKCERDLRQKRQHIHEQAETGAKNRLVREATNLRMDYTDDEMQRPFAVVSCVQRGDRQDVLETGDQAAGQLYGETIEDDAEIVDQDADQNDGDRSKSDILDSLPAPDSYNPTGPDAIDQIAAAVNTSGYDYGEAMNKAGKSPETPYGELSASNRMKLYRAAYNRLQQQCSFDDDDIPF